MKRPYLTVSLAIALSPCLIGVQVFAQATSKANNPKPIAAPPSDEERQAARVALEAKAKVLLNETIAEAASLKLTENRALVLATAADLLWKSDVKRARMLIQEAAANLTNIKVKYDRRGNSDAWIVDNTRRQVLLIIARRDAQAALEVLRTIRQQTEDAAQTNLSGSNSEQVLEQNLLTQLAVENPQLTLQLAEESLKKGVNHGVVSTIQRLQSKSPETAAKLVEMVVNRIDEASLTYDSQTAGAASYLLQIGASQRSSAATQAGSSAASPLMSDEQRRKLIELISNAAVNAPTGSAVMHAVQGLMPEIEKYNASQAEALRAKLVEVNRTLDPQQRAWNEYAPVLRSDNVEALLEAAKQAPNEIRNQLYSAAAWQLTSKGEIQRARQIVNDNISAPHERQQLLAMIDNQQLSNLINKNELEAARRIIRRNPDREARAKALVNIAVVAVKGENQKLTLELLNEADELVSGDAANDEQVNAQLQVARGFALIKSPRSFEIIGNLVERANEMLAAALVLDKFGAAPQGLFRNGELVMTSPHVGISSVLGRYITEIKTLAETDFTRTKATLEAFRRDELRTFARLMLAQAILSDGADSSKFVSEPR